MALSEDDDRLGRLAQYFAQLPIDTTHPPWEDCLRFIGETLHLDRLALYLLPENEKEPIRVAGIDPAPPALEVLTAALSSGEEQAMPDRLILPLQSRGRALGALSLYDEAGSRLSAGARAILAAQLALFVENGRLHAERDARLALFGTIGRIGRVLSLAPNLEMMFAGLRQETLALVDATGMSISLLDDDGQHMRWIYGYEYGRDVDLTGFDPQPLDTGFTGHVARTREILHLDARNVDLRTSLKSTIVGAPASAWLGLPLIVTNRLVGVFVVENAERADAFPPRIVDLLNTIAGPIAIAIENQRKYDLLETALVVQSQHRLQLQTAADISAAAASELDLEALMQTTVQLIQERFQLYYVGIYLVEGEADAARARLRAGTGRAGRRLVESEHAMPIGGPSLISSAIAEGEPRIVQDVATVANWEPNPYLPHTRAELALPLRVRGRLIGALNVQSTIADEFGPESLNSLLTMSDQVAIAIANARLLNQTQSTAERQQMLNTVSARLHRTADADAIIETALRALSDHFEGAPVALKLGRAAAPPDVPPTTA